MSYATGVFLTYYVLGFLGLSVVGVLSRFKAGSLASWIALGLAGGAFYAFVRLEGL